VDANRGPRGRPAEQPLPSWRRADGL